MSLTTDNKRTTIRVRQDQLGRLKALKISKRESYEEIIDRLLNQVITNGQ